MLLRRAARALWPHLRCKGSAPAHTPTPHEPIPANSPASSVAAPSIAPDSSPATAPTLGGANRSWACQLEEIMVKAYEPVLGGLLADTRAQLVGVCQELGVRRVLDVCCGPGGLTRRMAQAGLEVCGLDMSWPMLRQARKHCGARESAGAPSPLLVRADATALPFDAVPTVFSDATALPFARVPAVFSDATTLPPIPPCAAVSTVSTVAPDFPCAAVPTVSAVAPDFPFDAALLVLALHTMPPALGQGAVAEMLRVAPYAIVADYRLAERNCDLPAVALGRAVEWLVGGEHYACYKAFMAAGGLEAFARSHGYSPVLRRRVLGGAGTIIVLKAGA